MYESCRFCFAVNTVPAGTIIENEVHREYEYETME